MWGGEKSLVEIRSGRVSSLCWSRILGCRGGLGGELRGIGGGVLSGKCIPWVLVLVRRRILGFGRV